MNMGPAGAIKKARSIVQDHETRGDIGLANESQVTHWNNILQILIKGKIKMNQEVRIIIIRLEG